MSRVAFLNPYLSRGAGMNGSDLGTGGGGGGGAGNDSDCSVGSDGGDSGDGGDGVEGGDGDDGPIATGWRRNGDRIDVEGVNSGSSVLGDSKNGETGDTG